MAHSPNTPPPEFRTLVDEIAATVQRALQGRNILVVSQEVERIAATFPALEWNREAISKMLIQRAVTEGVAVEFDDVAVDQAPAPRLGKQDEYERNSPIYGQPVERRAETDER